MGMRRSCIVDWCLGAPLLLRVLLRCAIMTTGMLWSMEELLHKHYNVEMMFVFIVLVILKRCGWC